VGWRAGVASSIIRNPLRCTYSTVPNGEFPRGCDREPGTGSGNAESYCTNSVATGLQAWGISEAPIEFYRYSAPPRSTAFKLQRSSLSAKPKDGIWKADLTSQGWVPVFDPKQSGKTVSLYGKVEVYANYGKTIFVRAWMKNTGIFMLPR
jgi:hypothetical protein